MALGDESCLDGDSISDSNKESGSELRKGKAAAPARGVKLVVPTKTAPVLTAVPSEDSTEALLAAVLSDDSPETLLSAGSQTSRGGSDSESRQANSLVDELVATHQSFLSAVLGMAQVSIQTAFPCLTTVLPPWSATHYRCDLAFP